MSRPVRQERGAVLLVFVLSLTLLLIIVAFAIDLGQARFSKREEQAAADLAALDAGYYLSGRGASGTPLSQPLEACVAAAQSVQRNVAGFRPAIPDVTIRAQCAAQVPATAGACDPADPRSVVFSAGAYVLTIRYPVPTDELDVTRFSGGIGIDDGNDPCARMRVSLAKTDDTSFAGVIGVGDLDTTASAVVRANTTNTLTEVAALLLLERVGCGVLQTSGGGTLGSGVYVQSSGPNVPGIIAVDSAGQVPPCTTNNNADGWAVYGTAMPAASGGGPSITVEAATTPCNPAAGPCAPPIPGIISIYANSVGGRGGYTAPTGLNVAPTPGTIASRNVADERYNGVNGQISTLHATAYAATGTLPAGYATIAGSTECKGSIPPADLGASQVFVDCPTFEPDANIFPNATDFVVRGNISIKTNKTLSLPVIQRIYVRGCAVAGCSGSNQFAVDVGNGGALLLNTGDLVIPPDDASGVPTGTTCASRAGAGAGGTVTNTVRFATLGGRFDVGGFVRMCQTTLYVGEANTAAYARRTVTANRTGPENYPLIARCSATRPCPADTAAPLSYVTFNGGSGTADWSAPNQLSSRPTTADFLLHPFEDLALWTETSGASNIKGQGLNSTEGVYFLPNADFTFTGQGTQSQPLNAQFLSRRLNVSGQGSLVMRPNPADALEVTVVGDVALIR